MAAPAIILHNMILDTISDNFLLDSVALKLINVGKIDDLLKKGDFGRFRRGRRRPGGDGGVFIQENNH